MSIHIYQYLCIPKFNPNSVPSMPKPCHIPLTPGQSVTIHGWLRPKDTLCWTDVLADGRLSMDFLHGKTKITKELLHRMQPDIKAWVQAGRVRLEDAPSFLHVWPAHPVRDLKAGLEDMLLYQWDAKTMRAAGMTYEDLREAGMTYETMAVFNYTLYEWRTLGFGRAEAEAIPLPDIWRLFKMQKQDVLQCLSK
jgi:hypothetical protein